MAQQDSFKVCKERGGVTSRNWLEHHKDPIHKEQIHKEPIHKEPIPGPIASNRKRAPLLNTGPQARD